MIGTSTAQVQSTGNALQVKAGSRGFEIVFDEPEESGGANTGMNPVEACYARSAPARPSLR